jgi:hypothetical protein
VLEAHVSPEVAAQSAAAARAVLVNAGLSPMQSASQLADALAVKDKRLAIQEAQLARFRLNI